MTVGSTSIYLEQPYCYSFGRIIALETIRTPPRPDKIKAFFGDDAPSHYLISLGAEAKPWYLRPHYNPEEVLIDPDGTVRGGTVPALVERLTAHEYSGKSTIFTYTSRPSCMNRSQFH